MLFLTLSVIRVAESTGQQLCESLGAGNRPKVRRVSNIPGRDHAGNSVVDSFFQIKFRYDTAAKTLVENGPKRRLEVCNAPAECSGVYETRCS